MTKDKISTESYKGVRDFYPEDMAIQNYLFSKMKEVAESFGYQEYGASILEPAELYRAKSGEEIVNEQTYTFTDRGDREVTLRPEMTPTVARMIAKKLKELTFPVRWYSIPNLFRYENPQKGRLREHYQLNVDIFGAKGIEADTELISVAYSLLKSFGAKDDDFEVKINSRKLVNGVYDSFKLSEEARHKLSKIIDKKNKISRETYEEAVREITGDNAEEIMSIFEDAKKMLEKLGDDNESVKEVLDLIEILYKTGIKNVVFTPTLMRGFDYYTGIIFEVFDTDPENNRSMFGGGRYDELISLFSNDQVTACGFGMGDVTLRLFLESRGLPVGKKKGTKIYLCVLKDTEYSKVFEIAKMIREQGFDVEVDMSKRKVGDQISLANKKNATHVICIGSDEIESKNFAVKKLETGKENKGFIENIASLL